MEVADPARAFLADHRGPAPGSVVAPTLEGSRPILVEVQALVSPTGYGTPARKASGLDPNRLSLLIAVLGRRAGIGLGSHDVYANLAGGLSVDGARPRPAASPSRSRRRCAIGRSRRGRSRSARSACSASCAASSASSAACARRARLGFRRAIVPRPAAGAAAARIDGLDVVARRHAARGDRARARRPRRSSWRGRSRRC